nr:hypothetical protein [Paraburkholderia elongata]
MKLIQDFNTLLADTVNLNSTRFGLLESSIEAIESAVRGLDWKPAIVGFAAQGSWAHKTIIKPLPGSFRCGSAGLREAGGGLGSKGLRE